jgi:hypothetical protein
VNFPKQILLDGVCLLCTVIQLVLGWLTPLFQTPLFQAPGLSMVTTMEQIVQGNHEKQEK